MKTKSKSIARAVVTSVIYRNLGKLQKYKNNTLDYYADTRDVSKVIDCMVDTISEILYDSFRFRTDSIPIMQLNKTIDEMIECMMLWLDNEEVATAIIREMINKYFENDDVSDK